MAEWRARQARSEAAAEDALGANAGGVQTGLGSGAVAASGKAGVTGDLFAAQSGGQLISSMIERVEQQARQQQQRRQPQGRQAQAPQRGNRTTLAEHQRRQHQAGSEGESKVHRLVLSDEELAAKRGMPVKKKPMTSAAAANSPQINAAAVFRATRSREALRQAFILKEVFDPPVGLRDV